MNAYVEVYPSTLSQAMHRVAKALRLHSSEDITFVDDMRSADFVLLHVVGFEGLHEFVLKLKGLGKRVGLIQYCLKAMGGTYEDWVKLWGIVDVVWSYYDIADAPNFYHSPLGVDSPFTDFAINPVRDIGVMTSGYVSGPDAEAIEEIALAATSVGLTVTHLGPHHVVGMTKRPIGWSSIHNVDDETLAGYYRRARWVSGLRHGEGFELPVL
jgi:hypothetical protein